MQFLFHLTQVVLINPYSSAVRFDGLLFVPSSVPSLFFPLLFLPPPFHYFFISLSLPPFFFPFLPPFLPVCLLISSLPFPNSFTGKRPLYAPSTLSQYSGFPYLIARASPRFLRFPPCVKFYFVVKKSSVFSLLTSISRGVDCLVGFDFYMQSALIVCGSYICRFKAFSATDTVNWGSKMLGLKKNYLYWTCSDIFLLLPLKQYRVPAIDLVFLLCYVVCSIQRWLGEVYRRMCIRFYANDLLFK